MIDGFAELDIGRILVALDVSARDPTAFEAMAQLAAELHADLHVLFVEDTGLLRLARLPFAREMGYRGARERPLDFDEIERSLRVQAERAKRLLAQAAQGRAVQFSFQVTRGRFVPQALAAAEQADLVLLGNLVPTRFPTRAQSARYARPADKPVLVRIDQPADAKRMLAIGARLALATGRDLLVAVPQLDRTILDDLLSMALELLKPAGAQVKFIQLSDSDVAALVDVVNAELASMVVLGGSSDLVTQGKIDFLITRIGCPLVLAC